ncbi:MAG TPA: FecR domain-containing protein [Stellaceae bacterium]|nr:FecR domain-containing protein [Stellaceae bacterium]
MTASHGLIQLGAATAIVAALAAAPAIAQTPPAAPAIGVASAVNPQTTGEAPGGPKRTIMIGNNIVHSERVMTGPDGQAQILFVDSSAFSVGPNSDIVIDEFVYDPATNTGRLAASATKGVFRFVGGKISKSGENPVTVTTPSAAIGIRGGMMTFTVDGEGTTAVKNFGDVVHVTAKSTGTTEDIYRNDFYVTVNTVGQFANPVPTRVTQTVMQKINQPLNPPPRTKGGAKQVPTEVAIRESGFPTINSSATAQVALDVQAQQPITRLAAVDVGRVSSQTIHTTQVLTPLNNLSETVNNPSTAIGGLGLVQGQLAWRTNADLDLHLILPGTAGEVFFAQTSITFNNGGATAALDRDNVGQTINVPPNTRLENIGVVGRNIPAGTYSFFAFNFNDPNGSTAYTLTGTGNGGRSVVVQSGTLSSRQQGPNLLVNSQGGHFP